ncbi:MAG: DNA recombination protein RmuC [Treponema sp.]|jgi:DNA recombination protein RmuC|nr:DNA recombination protein RmuC [Treponema sp.]
MEYGFIVQWIILAVIIILCMVITIWLLKNYQKSLQHSLLKRLDEYDQWFDKNEKKLNEYNQRFDKNESNIRDEFFKNREETSKAAKESRAELSSSLTSVEEKLMTTITNFTGLIENKMQNIQGFLDSGLKVNRDELNTSIATFEKQVTNSINGFSDILNKELKDVQNRVNSATKESREELAASLKSFEEKSSARIEALTKDTKDGLDKNRDTVEKKLSDIQRENGEKLEQMRITVDEKLHDTLEKRLNESFQLVTTHLESVQKGLGEMQALASGVGDLKKVLSNVKTRGNLGEIQLGAILEEILSHEQFAKNVTIKEHSSERVDYVIKLPNKNDKNDALFLPVDSKFPNESYMKVLESYEQATTLPKNEIDKIAKAFEDTVKKCAKDIRDKYIDPPRTTDFAFMFVPTEGLFAEIARRTELLEQLRREYKVTVVGPTNFVAVLHSLQMGFQTLAIEKRSSEVWKTLSVVKTSFHNFGEALINAQKKLEAATKEINNVKTKSQTIERKLKSVEELPLSESAPLIAESESRSSELDLYEEET